MQTDLRSFWHQFQKGVEVAVASSVADKLLGVREGFLRYFHHGLERPVPVAVVTHPVPEEHHRLELSDEETLELARHKARRLQEELGETYHFYVGAEGGLHSIDLDGESHHFVRN